jgi:hypothetical protein
LAGEVGVFDTGGVFRAETTVHADARLAVFDHGGAVVGVPSEVTVANGRYFVSASSVAIAVSSRVSADWGSDRMDSINTREDHGESCLSSEL